MKKLLFTAIAMLAFSSASMANTIADDEVIIEEKTIVLRTKTLCELVAELQADNTYNQTGSTSAANLSYMLALTSCVIGGL